MRFLVAFVALLGYASASYLHGSLGYGVNPGTAHGAAIDAAVVAHDHARAWHDHQAGAAEAHIQHNAEAARQVHDTSRDIHENAYWNGVSANQEAVAAAQSHSAAVSGAVASHAGYGGYAGYGASLAVPYGVAGAWGNGLGLGVHGLGALGLGAHGIGAHGLGAHGLGLGLHGW